jgi:hypothetical protein
MACRGCAAVGDCACVIVGDGDSIVVTGSGSVGDPYVVGFEGGDLFDSFPPATVDACDPDATYIAKLGDGSYALIPAPGRCAVIV